MQRGADPFFWIIGGGFLQVPLMREVRALGYRTIVTDRDSGCACAAEADSFFAVDIFDVSGHLKLAGELVADGKRIAGVLAAGIDAPETMARLAEHLGLPSVDSQIAHLVNNKDQFRLALGRLGYPVPRFQVVEHSSFGSLDAAVAHIGFPLIVKNTDSSGSRGTKIFRKRDMAAIAASVELAMAASRSGRALLEECWEGPEQTVETLFDIDSNFHPCFITDRNFDRTDGYALEIGLRHPTSLPQETQHEMFLLAERVARDLGIRLGAAKYDMMLTKDGPRIIEMTVRLSGGFDCQYLVPAATGKNVLRAAALTALGMPFPTELLHDTKHRVGLSASLWPQPGRIVSITGVEEATRVPGVEHIFFRYEVGDMVQPYVDCTRRVCFVIVTGETEAQASATLRRVRELIRIETV